jgi:hypothetical protein
MSIGSTARFNGEFPLVRQQEAGLTSWQHADVCCQELQCEWVVAPGGGMEHAQQQTDLVCTAAAAAAAAAEVAFETFQALLVAPGGGVEHAHQQTDLCGSGGGNNSTQCQIRFTHCPISC